MTRFKAQLVLPFLLVVAAAASDASAAPLKVSATPTRVAPGGSVVVKYVVKKRPARLVLRLGARCLRTVKVRKARGRVTANLPRDVAPGHHRLKVCVRKACRSVTLTVVARTTRPGDAPAPAPGPGAPQSPPAAEPVDFTSEPNPLDVTASSDDARRVAKTIGPAGGTLQTTGADGTTYKVIVPAGALLSDEQITATPIASVGGLPFGGGLVA